MSIKDKKARRAALRDFLVAIPAGFDRATAALRWLVVLGVLALALMVLFAAFGHPGRRPPPPPGGSGDNPSAALLVRDLGRLPDGRHTFDLVYEMVLRNETQHAFKIAFAEDRLALGDVASPASAGGEDIVPLGHPPGLWDGPAARSSGAVVWHLVPVQHADSLGGDYPPGRWRTYAAHYRIRARPDQIVDIAIGYVFDTPPDGWFGGKRPNQDDSHHEEVQLGTVVRAHCALGVKVQNGEVRALCGS